MERSMFTGRADTGTRLDSELPQLREEDVVVRLPRGRVPVAYLVARSLGAPIDAILVGKLSVLSVEADRPPALER